MPSSNNDRLHDACTIHATESHATDDLVRNTGRTRYFVALREITQSNDRQQSLIEFRVERKTDMASVASIGAHAIVLSGHGVMSLATRGCPRRRL